MLSRVESQVVVTAFSLGGLIAKGLADGKRMARTIPPAACLIVSCCMLRRLRAERSQLFLEPAAVTAGVPVPWEPPPLPSSRPHSRRLTAPLGARSLLTGPARVPERRSSAGELSPLCVPPSRPNHLLRHRRPTRNLTALRHSANPPPALHVFSQQHAFASARRSAHTSNPTSPSSHNSQASPDAAKMVELQEALAKQRAATEVAERAAASAAAALKTAQRQMDEERARRALLRGRFALHYVGIERRRAGRERRSQRA